jgi:hypothetical protein
MPELLMTWALTVMLLALLAFALNSRETADGAGRSGSTVSADRYELEIGLSVAGHRRELLELLSPWGDGAESGTIWIRRQGRLSPWRN